MISLDVLLRKFVADTVSSATIPEVETRPDVEFQPEAEIENPAEIVPIVPTIC